MASWLDKYNDDIPNAQNGIEGTMGGLTDKGFNYNGAWGGTMAMGGSIPGAVGFTYARTQSPAPSNGPYAKKTKASAQNGMEMKYWQEGLDFKPKTISQDGDYIKKHPPIYLTDPKDPRIGRYNEAGNQYLYKKPIVKYKEREKPINIPEVKKSGVLNVGNLDSLSRTISPLEDPNRNLLYTYGTGAHSGVAHFYPESINKFIEQNPDWKNVIDTSDRGSIYTSIDKLTNNQSDNFSKPELYRLMNKAGLKLEDGGWLSKYDDGGIIEDDMGQWAHPGQVTKINSNQITMQGVDYPVLGISDTGDTQLMQPGEDYTFDGKSVTEYPMAQNGITRDGYGDPDYVTGTSRRAFNKMVGMGNYLVPANALNKAADLAKTKGLDYGATTSGPADAVRHAAAAASVASRLPVPEFIGQYSPDLDRAIRIAGANILGIGNEIMSPNSEGLWMDIKNNYQGSLIGSIPGLSDEARNKMIVNQLQKGKLTVNNPKKTKKENGGWLNKYE